MEAPTGKKNAAGGGERKRSGLVQLEAGQILFNEGDFAESLYIIQQGQLRLFRPKGKGFVELAVLRAGEVIGEMAYFDEDGSGRRRSCSAEAIVNTDIIEISFDAFGKTMSNLNPWFKTIVNTLAKRLRTMNSKVKELESNSVSLSYGAEASSYKFFKNIDVVRLFAVFYLTAKGQSEAAGIRRAISVESFKFYAEEIFGIQEVKVLEFLNLLAGERFVTIGYDNNNKPQQIVINDIESIRSVFLYLNSQRNVSEDKRIKIDSRCELFLDRIYKQIQEKADKDIDCKVNLTIILDEFTKHRVPIIIDDLSPAHQAKITGEIIVGEGGALMCAVDFEKLERLLPSIKIENAIKKINETKDHQQNKKYA